jgi:hypothetical protein
MMDWPFKPPARCSLAANAHCAAPVVSGGYCAEHLAKTTRDVWCGDSDAHARAAEHDRRIIDGQKAEGAKRRRRRVAA